jgi:hypothetical protein
MRIGTCDGRKGRAVSGKGERKRAMSVDQRFGGVAVITVLVIVLLAFVISAVDSFRGRCEDLQKTIDSRALEDLETQNYMLERLLEGCRKELEEYKKRENTTVPKIDFQHLAWRIK